MTPHNIPCDLQASPEESRDNTIASIPLLPVSATRRLATYGFRGRNHLVKVARSAIARPVLLNINKLIRFVNVNARSFRNKTEVFIDHVIGESIDV